MLPFMFFNVFISQLSVRWIIQKVLVLISKDAHCTFFIVNQSTESA